MPPPRRHPGLGLISLWSKIISEPASVLHAGASLTEVEPLVASRPYQDPPWLRLIFLAASALALLSFVALAPTASTAAAPISLAPAAGTLNGMVCEGINGNGVCETGETGLANVTVSLRWAGSDGVFGNGDDTVGTTQSSSSGVFQFTGLPSGLFRVLETNPSGYNSLSDADGGPPDQINLSVGANQTVNNQDFEDGPVSIGVAKSVSAIGSNGDGSFTVTFVLMVANLGGASLQAVQVSDNLALAFAGVQSLQVLSVTSATFTPRPDYDGDTRTDMLAGSDSLPIGASGLITLSVRVVPGANLGPYQNQATAAGTSPAGTTLADVSDNGLNPDPNGNGDPTETGENDSTPVLFEERPGLGLAKRVQSVDDNGDGSYSLSFALRLENLGDVPLHDIQISDDLTAAFIGAAGFVVDTIGSPDFTLSDTFDGVANLGVLGGGVELAPGASGTAAIDVTVWPGGKVGPYSNQALATGTSPASAEVSDLSDGGVEVDANQNGSAGDPGEDDATQFFINPDPVVGLAKHLASTASNGSGSFTLRFDFRIVNLGGVPLSSVQVVDDLDEVFAGVSSFSVTGLSSSSLTVNPAYNGKTVVEMLSGGNSLDVGLGASLSLTMTVTPGAALGPFYNQAVASAGDPLGATIGDLSEDGAEPIPDGNGLPSGNSPTPIDLAETGGSIGDKVWWDVNGNGQQDTGEPGIAGVTVILGGAASATTTTDANGLYAFNGLDAGNYSVTISSAEFAAAGTLQHWSASPQNVGSDSSDSDGDGATHAASLSLGSGVANATIDFGFRITTSYAITQRLNGYSPIRPGEPISFTIRITNTGNTWLTTLPVSDVYDTDYLGYGFGSSFALPDSNDHSNDGRIDWSDLTAGGFVGLGATVGDRIAGGLGADLAPGGSLAVIVWFTGGADTSDLPGGATTCTAQITGGLADPDGPAGPLQALAVLPVVQASGSIEIRRPTAVGVFGLRAVAAGQGVMLAWQTSSETGIAAFRWARRVAGGAIWMVAGDLIEAEHAGSNQGGAYQYSDVPGCAPGCGYRLQVFGLDGRTWYIGPLEVEAAPLQLFLPSVSRR